MLEDPDGEYNCEGNFEGDAGTGIDNGDICSYFDTDPGEGDSDRGNDSTDSALGHIIVFHTNRDGGDFEIYLANGDGSQVMRLTNSPGPDLNPSLSPDGEHVVFESTRDENREIYIMRRDGGEVTNLTANPSADEQPVFSPNGKKIAFVSDRDGNKEIYTMNRDGTGVARLTNESRSDIYPVYASDGEKLFFISMRDRLAGEIYSMDSRNGTGITRHTSNFATERALSISPNGDSVVFSSNMKGQYELYRMDLNDGVEVNRLTTTTGLDEAWPSWSNDGERIFFSACGKLCNIYSMGKDGEDIYQITNSARSEHPSSAYGRLIDMI